MFWFLFLFGLCLLLPSFTLIVFLFSAIVIQVILSLRAFGKLQNSLSDDVPSTDRKNGHPALKSASETHRVPSKPQWYSFV